jgi:hypothetical protein
MQDLLEICSLWCHVVDDLKSYIGKGPELDKIEGMWEQGCLDWVDLVNILCFLPVTCTMGNRGTWD